MKLPIGQDDFKSIIAEGFTFVDKSLFIKDIVNDSSLVSLITRPRRFGKTLNLSMLYYFFTNQNKLANAQLFDKLKIKQEEAIFPLHQGAYPVIYLTLKDVRESTFKDAYENICGVIQTLYCEHDELLSSDKLKEVEKEIYRELMSNIASSSKVTKSLRFLSDCLYKHYGQKVIILIDEYDTPILSSHGKYFDEMINFMRNFYGMVLKGNPAIFKGIMTGILRVAKENIFSGLNNLKVFSLLNSRHGEYFGFTESEVNELLVQADLLNSAQEIKSWYNGYKCGDITIYNPWSIINCLSEQGTLQPYWVNTSGNDLVKKILSASSSNVKEKFQTLLYNEVDITITATINESLSLADISHSDSALWSLLVFTGYLKVISSEIEDLDISCQLAIPNREVKILYRNLFKDILVESIKDNGYTTILSALSEGRVGDFCNSLKEMMEQVISSHDTSNSHPEKFYHGLILGLAHGLRGNYLMFSNQESGYGRFDLLLLPKDQTKQAIMLEFKKVAAMKLEAESIAKKLQEAADEGLAQIISKNYPAALAQHEISKTLLLSLAFAGKVFAYATKVIECE